MDQKTKFALGAFNTDDFRTFYRQYGIRAKTGYKWKGSFLREGHEVSLNKADIRIISPDALDGGTM